MRALMPYGTIYSKPSWGSGGGSHLPLTSTGGHGGGFVYIHATEKVVIERSGVIKANAGNAKVWLNVGNILVYLKN